jgi:Mg-chelatase subunit ChlD
MMGSKLEQAKRGAIDFAQEALRSGYRIALVSFDCDAQIHLEPTGDAGAVEAAVSRLSTGGSTNMTAGLRTAGDLVGGSGARVVCVATDGAPNSRRSAIETASGLRSRGIDIMAVGTEDADQAFLSRIVSREELARAVRSEELQAGIGSMARLLPGARG